MKSELTSAVQANVAQLPAIRTSRQAASFPLNLGNHAASHRRPGRVPPTSEYLRALHEADVAVGRAILRRVMLRRTAVLAGA